MYLLCLDESGNENHPKDRFFVLCGIALFERQTSFLTQKIKAIQSRYFPGPQPVPFYASDTRSERDFRRRVPDDVRNGVVSDVISAIRTSPARGRCLCAAAIEKSDVLWGEAAVERATEEVCRRFDIRLSRVFHEKRTRSAD